MNDESRLMQYYGATKDPETGDFIIVMQFIYDGSLKNFLDKNEIQYGWQWKLNILHYLAQDLNTIHDAGLFHNDVKNENVFVVKKGFVIIILYCFKKCFSTIRFIIVM